MTLPTRSRASGLPSRARHYALIVRVGRGAQMSFEAFDAWARLRTAIESVDGSVAGIEARGPYACWTFVCEQSFEEIATAIDGVTDGAAWAMKCDDRMQYDGWSAREFARLIAAFEQD